MIGGDGYNYFQDSYHNLTRPDITEPTGDDTLDGGGGDDFLIVKDGVDVAIGGDGDGDRLMVDYRQETRSVTLSPGFVNAGADRSVTYSGIEKLTVYAGSARDHLVGGDSEDVLDGADNADTLAGGVGNDTVVGGGGDDLLIDGLGNDALLGLAGTDTADFSAAGATLNIDLATRMDGSNVVGDAVVGRGIETNSLWDLENVIGGAFHDVVRGRSVANVLSGEGGGDQLFGEGGADTLYGGADDDTLNGGAGDDHLFGGAGNDVFAASAGADVMDGGGGDDRFLVDDASDEVIETAGGGKDVVFALGDWTMGAGQRIELVTVQSGAGGLALGGNELANRIYGDSGADTLSGGAGVDRLIGAGGADRLVGGDGADFLRGDAGADIFVFDAKPVSTAERDRIADFAPGQDQIEIDASEFGGGLVAGAEVNLVASDRPTSAGQKGPTFLYDTDTGNLSYDDDGQGGHAAVTFAVLLKASALTSDDFLIVA